MSSHQDVNRALAQNDQLAPRSWTSDSDSDSDSGVDADATRELRCREHKQWEKGHCQKKLLISLEPFARPLVDLVDDKTPTCSTLPTSQRLVVRTLPILHDKWGTWMRPLVPSHWSKSSPVGSTSCFPNRPNVRALRRRPILCVSSYSIQGRISPDQMSLWKWMDPGLNRTGGGRWCHRLWL